MRILLVTTFIFLLFYSFHPACAVEAKEGDRFKEIDHAYVVDSQTGLMWALKDNGKDIDWWDAEQYCKDFSAGGYTDWRLPDIKELATLYSGGDGEKEGYSIAGNIKITDCCIWSSYDVLGGALSFSFKSGKRIPSSFAETYQLRALPVRGTSKIDLSEHKNF